ncbi:MAG: STAS domain-containing protein [Leptospiraceae bacterium]|jgi:anti-sigma B factor antagonist|nr:STAS domain-containing protein [Leptospiraceae bacterium]MBK9498511.1 STAS domain-containing protein [Leptospiraceae bacterium]MBP6740569.1 STAS domain-containing protein [Leptospiraceae bacterium]MBP9161578.1 STAS domain-containing protein [Leptospiraceae bacterium]HRG47230.1 STAS domain-containing protein [Leptospiraceae bacterium]
MEITKRKSGETIVIELSGSLDIYTATDFKTYLQANVNTDHSKVVVNMEKLNYIDSSGIGMLIKSLNYMKELDGQLQLANLKESLQKIFKVAGLTAYFQFITEKEFKEKYLA